MLSARADHTATLLSDGRVLIVGGTGDGYTFLATALLYDPATSSFAPTGPMSVARESATATLLRDGRVLVTGGHAGRHEAIRIYASAEVYDPGVGRFRAVGDMTIPRHKHDAVRLRDGRVLIVGGSDERDDAGLYRSTEVFDPATDTFHATGRLHEGRYKMRGTTVRLADGRVVVCCGAARAELFDLLLCGVPPDRRILRRGAALRGCRAHRSRGVAHHGGLLPGRPGDGRRRSSSSDEGPVASGTGRLKDDAPVEIPG